MRKMTIQECIEVAQQMLKELPNEAKWGNINYADLAPRKEALQRLINLAICDSILP